VEGSDSAVGENEARFILERAPLSDGFLKRGADALPIVWMDVTKEIINGGWLRSRIESKKTIAVIGPGYLRGFKVPFPASQIGKALRLGQERFAVAKEVFDRLMPQPNQVSRTRLHVRVLRDDFLQIHHGTRTEEGFRLNIRVGVQYIESWLRGRGAVPIYNLMEDAATAEISRAQIWQQLKYRVTLENGVKVTPEFFERALAEEMRRVEEEVGVETYAEGRFTQAIDLFRTLSLSEKFVEFLTIPAYRLIV